MNTRLYYSYTDGNNYSRETSAVVAGEISDEQREQIRGSLDHEEDFVPTQVGLPDGSLIGRGYQPTDMDGDSHHLYVDSIETTNDLPTAGGDIAAVTAAFVAHRGAWDWEGLPLPKGDEWTGISLTDDLAESPERAAEMVIWAVGREVDGGRVERGAWRDEASAKRALRAADRQVKGGKVLSCWGEAYTEAGWAVCCRAWRERGYTPPELPPLTVAAVGLGA
jgi:hypothetical protein